MSAKKLISLKEIDLELLQDVPVNVFSLRASIERGVMLAYPPWSVADQYSISLSQRLYDETIKKFTNQIMLIVVNELYLKT